MTSQQHQEWADDLRAKYGIAEPMAPEDDDEGFEGVTE